MSSTSELTIGEPKRRSAWVDFFIRLVREKPLGLIGGVIVLVLLITGAFANIMAPYGFNETHPEDFLQGPSAKYWLGTDNLGRDELSRVIYGARISVVVGLTATSLSIVISTVVGTLCGFLRGKFDIVVQRFVDAWMCFPGLVLLIAFVSLLGPGMWQVIVVLGLQYGIAGSRAVRSAVLGIIENVYLRAATAIGCSSTRTLTHHILPNIMAPIIILFTTRVPGIIIAEASLSFLGLGIPAPTPTWGGALSGSARSYMLMAPWMAIWPGLALAIVVYGINMFGDALRDILDPRLRGGGGRYVVKKKKKQSKSAGIGQGSVKVNAH